MTRHMPQNRRTSFADNGLCALTAARERQPQRRDLVGGECERGTEGGHERGFPKNPSDREQAVGNPGLCRIIFHTNLAPSVDESAPVRQSLFHHFFSTPHAGLRRRDSHLEIRPSPARFPGRRRPECVQTTIIKPNDMLKQERFCILIQKLPSIGQNMVGKYPALG